MTARRVDLFCIDAPHPPHSDDEQCCPRCNWGCPRCAELAVARVRAEGRAGDTDLCERCQQPAGTGEHGIGRCSPAPGTRAPEIWRQR